MSGHGRTDKLLSPIRIIVRVPEPDCFLRYRISAGTRGIEPVSRRNTFVGGTCATPSGALLVSNDPE